jgi:hypothetical protein
MEKNKFLKTIADGRDFETCMLLDVAKGSQMFSVRLIKSPENIKTFFSMEDIVKLIGIKKLVIIENVNIKNIIFSKLNFTNQKNLQLLINTKKILVGGT